MLAHARDIYPTLQASPRACAYALLGLARDPNFNPEILKALSAPLMAGWNLYGSVDWPWPEAYLTYDNARILEACFLTANALDDSRLRSLAAEGEVFLTCHSFGNGILHPVGNRGWWNKGSCPAIYDQQPLEAAAYAALYRLIGAPALEEASIAWFLGKNSQGVCMVDVETGFCRDGLQPEGPNANAGSESIISWLLAIT